MIECLPQKAHKHLVECLPQKAHKHLVECLLQKAHKCLPQKAHEHLVVASAVETGLVGHNLVTLIVVSVLIVAA
jgi:hypothetical protein